MSSFSSNFLVVDTFTVIAMCYIESISFASKEDLTVDKLSGDCTFSVRTISGKEYKVSALAQAGYIVGTDIEQWAQSIYDRWKYILIKRFL